MKILFGINFNENVSSFQKTILEKSENISILKQQLYPIYSKDLNINLMNKSVKISELYTQNISNSSYEDDLPF